MSATQPDLEVRSKGIGGSDAGAVLGVNPYRSAVDVYLEKIGAAQPFEGNQATYWGQRLEDIVADEYARRAQVKVRRRNQTLFHADIDFMLAHIDRSVDGQRKVLECKTANQYMTDKWGPAGTDQVPDEYLIQVTHYMIVTGYQLADLAVLIGGQDFRIYHFERDDELARLVLEKEHAFWHQHVRQHEPPPPQSARDVETLYAIDNGEAVLASETHERAVKELRQLRDERKRLESLESDIKAELKTALGPNSILVDAAGEPLITWKKAKDAKRFDAKRFADAHPDLHAEYITTTPGSRRFLLK